MKFVLMASVRACVQACSLGWQRNLFAVLAHPANLLGGHTHHQRIGLDVFVNHRSSAHKGKFTNGGTADNGAVGPERGPFFDQGVAVFAFALNQRARVVNVGEDHAGAAEHPIFQRDVVVHADIVLDLAVVANDHLVAHEHVLAQGHAFADLGATAHMYKVPHATALSDLGAFVNDGRGVNGDVGEIQAQHSSGKDTFTPSLAERYMATNSSKLLRPERPSVSGSACPRKVSMTLA